MLLPEKRGYVRMLLPEKSLQVRMLLLGRKRDLPERKKQLLLDALLPITIRMLSD